MRPATCDISNCPDCGDDHLGHDVFPAPFDETAMEHKAPLLYLCPKTRRLVLIDEGRPILPSRFGAALSEAFAARRMLQLVAFLDPNDDVMHVRRHSNDFPHAQFGQVVLMLAADLFNEISPQAMRPKAVTPPPPKVEMFGKISNVQPEAQPAAQPAAQE